LAPSLTNEHETIRVSAPVLSYRPEMELLPDGATPTRFGSRRHRPDEPAVDVVPHGRGPLGDDVAAPTHLEAQSVERLLELLHEGGAQVRPEA
jgi:hypothetical protein